MENYEISKHIEDYKTRIGELSKAIKIDKIEKEVVDSEELMKSPTFYNDMQQAHGAEVRGSSGRFPAVWPEMKIEAVFAGRAGWCGPQGGCAGRAGYLASAVHR